MIVSRSVLQSGVRVSSSTRHKAFMVGDARRPAIQMSHRRTFFWGRSGGHQRHGSKSWYQRSFTSTSMSPSRDPGLEVTSVISDPKEVQGPKGVPSRAEQIRRLQSPTINKDGVFDILVIGGGATGCGVAMDAAQRGLQTACIERGDFASETSSRSTKLIWVRCEQEDSSIYVFSSADR
jgi:FAD dependent oxidoreductase